MGGYMGRRNIDKKVNENGREWLSLSRATGLVAMTGVRETANYTCYNDQGNSVVDHICIEEESMNLVEQIEYMKEVMGRINTDHSMVRAKIKLKGGSLGKREREEKNKDRTGAKRGKKKALNRVKKREVWEEYKKKCNESKVITKVISDWDKRRGMMEMSAEEAWEETKKLRKVMEEWAREIAKRRGDINFKHINSRIKSDRNIAEKIEKKTRAWKKWERCRDREHAKVLKRIYNNCKNVLNKARKKLRKEHKGKGIEEIGELGSKYQGEFWRLLKQVAGKRRKEKSQKKTVDEKGKEVEGEEAKRVWREAFEKLGKREERKGIFDDEFGERIEDENREIESKNIGRGG